MTIDTEDLRIIGRAYEPVSHSLSRAIVEAADTIDLQTAQLAAQAAKIARLKAALKFYADRGHLLIADEDAWEAPSGEPGNFLCDAAGTATVEDGAIARAALSGELHD